MPTSTRCFSPVKGLIIRLIKTDDCGVPVTGTGSAMVVTAGFTRVQATAQYDTGNRQLTRRADGQMCTNDKDPDILTNLELTIDLCSIDPGLVANSISPARLLTSSESPTGTGFALAEGAATTHWSLELWQKVSGQCPSPLRYVYNAWPHVTDGKLGGDYTAGLDPTTLTIQANSLPVSPQWAAGATWLGAGAVLSTVPDHWFWNITTAAPPTATCGIQDFTG